MPALTEETRQDYIKQARAEAENSRVSIRNIRRDANQAAKEKQQSSEISEDELRRIEDLIQKETLTVQWVEASEPLDTPYCYEIEDACVQFIIHVI